MTMNINPTFPLTPQVEWGTITTANTAKDGTGTVVTIFTADVTNGSWVQFIKLKPLGTNTASVLRIFLNNGSANSTPANNSLLYEYSLAATTLTEIAGQSDQQIDCDWTLPAGYKLNITIGTTVEAGWQVTAFGRKF